MTEVCRRVRLLSTQSHDGAWNIRASNTLWSRRSIRPVGSGRLSEKVAHPEPKLPSIGRKLSAQRNEQSATRSEISNGNSGDRFAALASISMEAPFSACCLPVPASPWRKCGSQKLANRRRRIARELLDRYSSLTAPAIANVPAQMFPPRIRTKRSLFGT